MADTRKPLPPYLWRAIAIFIMAPVLVWLLIMISERLAKPSESYIVNQMQVYSEDGQSVGSASLNKFRFYSLPVNDQNTVIMAADLSAQITAYKKPAILVERVSRYIEGEMDGLALSETGGVNGVRLYKYFEPHLYILPPGEKFFGGIRTGHLKLKVSDRDSVPRLRITYIGEATDLLAAFRWRTFIGVTLVIAAAGVTFMSALISFALLLSSANRRLMLSFGLMTLCWTVVCVDYAGLFSGFRPEVSRMFYTVAIFAIIVLAFDFVNNWTFNNRFIRRYCTPVIGCILAGLMIPAFFGSQEVYSAVILSADVVSAAVVLVMLSQLFWYLATQPNAAWIESLVFLAHISAVIMDILLFAMPGIAIKLWPETGMTLHYGTILSLPLGLTIIARFVRHAVAVQTRLKTANAELSKELAAREAEIARAYADRAEQQQQAALMEERKRIMRDMHDGVGGRLLSLSLRVKNGDLEEQTLKDELDESMQDLRLIVDSMDTADGELDLALGALRGRLEPLLFTGNVSLSWDAQELGRQPLYGPREVLSIYRIIQEAATNIVRHAEASHMNFKSSKTDDGQILIEIIDNGQGIKSGEGVQSGQGLSNIETRAQSLGGRSEIGGRRDGKPGTRIAVYLPQS